MRFKQFIKFWEIPLSIKVRLIRLLFCRIFRLKCLNHDVIWGSVFLFATENSAKIGIKQKVYQINFHYQDKPLVIRVRSGSSTDVFTFFQIFISDEYQPFFEWAKGVNVKTIMDCGANVGYFSIQALTSFPESMVYSIEPDEENLNELVSNLTLNEFQLKATPLLGAIWPKHESLEIDEKGGEWAYQVRKSNISKGLKGFPLKLLMEKAGYSSIDVLKIDVEGTEDVLFKDHSFLETLKVHVQFLIIEIHDNFTNRSNIYKKLSECGFDFFDRGELTICTKSND